MIVGFRLSGIDVYMQYGWVRQSIVGYRTSDIDSASMSHYSILSGLE
jgi:hypothetical protein